MEYSKLVSQFFVALRGSRSREQCARQLNIDKSTIYKWENQLNKPSWLNLGGYIKKNKVEVRLELYNKMGVINYLDGNAIVTHFCETNELSDVIKTSKVTRQTLNSIVQKKQDPKVELIFRIWHQFSPHSFIHFLDQSVGLENLDETKIYSKNWNIEFKLSEKYPFFAGAIHILERSPKIIDAAKIISDHFNVEPSDTQEFIDKLLQAGFIEKKKEHYFLINKHLFDSTRHFESFKRLNNYWATRAIDQFPKDEERYKSIQSHYGYLVVSLSKDAYQQAYQEYVNFYTKIREIALSDQDELKSTHSLTVQFVDIADSIKLSHKT